MCSCAYYSSMQAWGVLEQRSGNISAARRLFRSSLNINSQSYITWMTWASFEEDQGNTVRAEEIRNLYFQQVSNYEKRCNFCFKELFKLLDVIHCSDSLDISVISRHFGC